MLEKETIVQGKRVYRYSHTEQFELGGDRWERDIYLLDGNSLRERALMEFRKLDVAPVENDVTEDDLQDYIQNHIRPFGK